MVCCSNRSGRMIMPTLVRVRNISSSSSKATNGAGILPFITPMSKIWRGSTWPSRQGAVQRPSAMASASGVSPTAPLYVNPAVEMGNVGQVPAATPSLVAGSPGWSGSVPRFSVLELLGKPRPGRAFARAASQLRVTVAARGLLAFDGAVHVRRRRLKCGGGGRRKDRRSGVRGFNVVIVERRRVGDGAGWTLHPERLGGCHRWNKTD